MNTHICVRTYLYIHKTYATRLCIPLPYPGWLSSSPFSETRTSIGMCRDLNGYVQVRLYVDAHIRIYTRLYAYRSISMYVFGYVPAPLRIYTTYRYV